MKFLVCFVGSFLLTRLVHTQDVPQITTNGTTIDVTHDDIAHFTCSARGQPTPSISWQRSGKILTNNDKGVKILETNISQLISSHLFVAMTDSGRRGRYVCVASNKHGQTEKTFIITKEEASSGLTQTDYIAIGLSLALTLIILGFSFYFIRVKVKNNKRHTQTTGTAELTEAHSNPVAEESQETQDVVTAL